MNHAELYNNRVEERFLVSPELSKKVGELLPQFTQFRPTVNGLHFPVTRNVYFGRNGEVGRTGLIRTRQYVTDLSGCYLDIRGDERCIVETKLDSNGAIQKSKTNATYDEALALFADSPNLWRAIDTYDSDDYRKRLHQLLMEFDMMPLLPQLAIVFNRRHLHPIQQGINCRITIDDDLNYYAFGDNDPYRGLLIGSEGFSKLEVKYLQNDNSFAHPLIESLRDSGAVPFSTLQHKAVALLRESRRIFFPTAEKKKLDLSIESSPMYSLRFANLVNEFPDSELELKLNVDPKDPLGLITLIRDRLLAKLAKPFILLPDQADISYWRYFLDIYGQEIAGEMQQAFVVVRHPDKSKFMAQEKGAIKATDSDEETVVLNRPEEKFRVERAYEDCDLDVIKAMFEERFKNQTTLIATNRKTKYYIFVRHENTGRFYNIAVDLSEDEDNGLVQVEIEYKGIDPKKLEVASRDEVTAELNLLADRVKETPGFKLNHTTLTKFQWFLSRRQPNIIKDI